MIEFNVPIDYEIVLTRSGHIGDISMPEVYKVSYTPPLGTYDMIDGQLKQRESRLHSNSAGNLGHVIEDLLQELRESNSGSITASSEIPNTSEEAQFFKVLESYAKENNITYTVKP